MKTKLRVGIIGAGSVVREIYQHLFFHSEFSEILEICCVADPNAEYRTWFAGVAGLPPERCFADYSEMLQKLELDAAQINTPDHLHRAPTLAALECGLDVVLPKPAAATVKDADVMLRAASSAGRFIGIDFHKREDPRIKEARARYASGRHGTFQAAVFYMLDKLLVADPNHQPRFFASPDFASKNTPVSFLTVHMADALMNIVGLRPTHVRALGYAHKLPSLKPTPVNGYDLVDTEIMFDNGAVAHILTGWALPNSAWSTTVQSGRLVCSEGMIDLGLDMPGLREIHPSGVIEVNPLFRNFEADGNVTGYGISSPGRLYEKILALRQGKLSREQARNECTPEKVGFYTTLVLEAAERSLSEGDKLSTGATIGQPQDLKKLLRQELGAAAADYLQQTK